jgi:hypothetical protein
VSNISSARLRPTARATAGRGRQPLDLRDHGLRDRRQRLHQVGAYTEKPAHPDEVAPVHVAEIVSRGEHGPLGREDDPTRLAFPDSAKGVE